jgi:squalene-associated FAD-dependent desaturase
LGAPHPRADPSEDRFGAKDLVGLPMKKVIVIGGGFAGLSAATALAEQGCDVTLLEGRQVLGGRAYSFVDRQTGDSVDNGQHLFMGCYRQTIAFLERIGTLNRLEFQKNLTVDFVGSRGRSARLSCLPLPAPLHLASGLVRLSTLSWGDRWRLMSLRRALRQAARSKEALDQLTVEDWLKSWNQSQRARRYLWDLITIAALNEDPRIASAAPFAEVLSRAFFGGRRASQIGLAQVGLSELYANAARVFIERRDGQVRLRAPVERLVIAGKTVTGVALRDGTSLAADWVISAVPSPALLRLVPAEAASRELVFQRMLGLRSSPILSLHFWFDRSVSRSLFAGLLDTQIQWFFNKSKILARPKTREGYVSVVISGARSLVDWPEADLLSLAMEELRRLFPMVRQAALLRSLVIKEHHATLSPAVGVEALRPEHRSPIKNLLLAGDWTKTGLPATIESACVSGHACAEIIRQGATEIPQNLPEVAHV